MLREAVEVYMREFVGQYAEGFVAPVDVDLALPQRCRPPGPYRPSGKFAVSLPAPRIIDIDPRRIMSELNKDRIVIVAGFQGVNFAREMGV